MARETEIKKLDKMDLWTIREFQRIFPQWKWFSVINKLRKTISGKNKRFIAIRHGNIVGHMKISLRKGIHRHRAQIKSLLVVPGHRRKGIGSKLVKHGLKSLPKKIKVVTVAIDKNNKKAIKLYKKLGFKKYGLLKKASKINKKFVDNYLMEKSL